MIGLSLAKKKIHYFFYISFGKPVQQFITNLGNPSLAAGLKKNKTKNPETT